MPVVTAAGRVDRDREIGPFALRGFASPFVASELLGTLRSRSERKSIRGRHRHEVHRFWRHFLGRDHQIAFILAIGVVSHDHDFAFGDVAHDVVNRVERKVSVDFPIIERDATLLVISRYSLLRLRAIQVAVAALELGFEFHFELRKIDHVPASEFHASLFSFASCSNPTTKCTASSRLC